MSREFFLLSTPSRKSAFFVQESAPLCRYRLPTMHHRLWKGTGSYERGIKRYYKELGGVLKSTPDNHDTRPDPPQTIPSRATAHLFPPSTPIRKTYVPKMPPHSASSRE